MTPSNAAMALLEFVGIAARATEKASNLPYGDQRRLEIARTGHRTEAVVPGQAAAGFNPSEKTALMG